MGTIKTKMESWLYKRGFEIPEVRQLISMQLALASVSILVVSIVTGFGSWATAFTVAALLVTVNFYHLAKFVQKIVYVRKGAVLATLIRFYGRLILTGVVLYALIAWVHADVFALLAGVSTVVASSLLWGATRIFGHNVKEA